VKARLDMSKVGATVQCPNHSCNARRTLSGQITRLSVETEQGVWGEVDAANWFVYPPEESPRQQGS
jgi:hypothetical protein